MWVFEVTDLHLTVLTPVLLCRKQKILHLPHPIRAGLAAMVVTVSMDNAVSIIGTKQPIRIVLLFPRIFCSVPVLVGNGIESRLSHYSLIRWQREVFRINDFETSLIALYLASQCA